MATLAQAIQSAHSNPDERKRSIPNIPTQIGAQPNALLNAVSSQCRQCDDLKFIRLDVPMGHPSFGRVVPCPACSKSDAILAGLNAIERRITFADVEIQDRPGAAAMLSAAQKFIADGRTGFLAVHGGFGNGKSTLLKAIVNDCIAYQVEVRYITMTEVMVYAREAFDSEQRGDSDYGRISRLAATQVLVIDELDKARITDYAREVQTHLFDTRYRNSHLLGTVVAWNGAFTDLDLPWVRSRLSEFLVVENRDKDMRPLLGGLA